MTTMNDLNKLFTESVQTERAEGEFTHAILGARYEPMTGADGQPMTNDSGDPAQELVVYTATGTGLTTGTDKDGNPATPSVFDIHLGPLTNRKGEFSQKSRAAIFIALVMDVTGTPLQGIDDTGLSQEQAIVKAFSETFSGKMVRLADRRADAGTGYAPWPGAEPFKYFKEPVASEGEITAERLQDLRGLIPAAIERSKARRSGGN